MRNLINQDVFGFADAELERKFSQQWLQGSLVQVRISLVLSFLFAVCFIMLDWRYFDAITQVEVAFFRLLYMGPLCIVLIAMTFSQRLLPYVFPGCALAALSFSAYFCILAVRLDHDILSFLFPLLVEVALFLFIMLRVPFQLTLITAVLTVGLCVYSFANMPGNDYDRLSYLSGMLAIFGMLLISVYQRDMRERALFLNRLQLEESEAARRKIEREREEWYRNFASFVRHEVNNQMVGVQSSLELIQRVPEQREKYTSRAEAALARMRAMVNEAADATSIDSALETGEVEVANLSDIVNECVDEYAQSYPDQLFVSDVERGIYLCGQPFRLYQLLDKLLTNAQQHVKPGSPIRVSLAAEGERIVLTVENEGDPLPDDTAALFRLWHTGAKGQGTGRRGLGLYVVSRIAEAHGGSVRAEPLSRCQGANMVVEFPCREPRGATG